jgi:hypothetical protein
MFGSFPGKPWSLSTSKLTGPKEPTTLWNQSVLGALRLGLRALPADHLLSLPKYRRPFEAGRWPVIATRTDQCHRWFTSVLNRDRRG